MNKFFDKINELNMFVIPLFIASVLMFFAVDQGTKYLVDIDEQNGIHWPGHK